MIGADKPPFATFPNSVFDTGGTFGSNCQTSGEISKSNMADINSRHDRSSYIHITLAPGVFVPSSSPSNGINFINSTADPVPTSPLSALPREDINSKLPKNSLHSSPPPDRPKTFSEAVATAGITLNSEARFTVNDGTHQAGKNPGSSEVFSISPNSEMLAEILEEKSRLKSTAIFFSAVEIDKVPP